MPGMPEVFFDLPPLVYLFCLPINTLLLCSCVLATLKVTAAKRKEDQKVKEQVKKEDQKIKRARIDVKKDTVRRIHSVLFGCLLALLLAFSCFAQAK